MPLKIESQEERDYIELGFLSMLIDHGYHDMKILIKVLNSNQQAHSELITEGGKTISFIKGFNKTRLKELCSGLSKNRTRKIVEETWSNKSILDAYLSDNLLDDKIKESSSSFIVDGLTEKILLEVCLLSAQSSEQKCAALKYFSSEELSFLLKDGSSENFREILSIYYRYPDKHKGQALKYLLTEAEKFTVGDMQYSFTNYSSVTQSGKLLFRLISENNSPKYDFFHSIASRSSKFEALRMESFSKSETIKKDFTDSINKRISNGNYKIRLNSYSLLISSGLFSLEQCAILRRDNSSKVTDFAINHLNNKKSLYSDAKMEEFYMELISSNNNTTLNKLAVTAPLDIVIPYLSGNPKVRQFLIRDRIAKES